MIGKALEWLLRSVDYVASFYSEYPKDDVETLGDARVALILPALSSGRREALIDLIRTTPSTTNLPLIELITTPNKDGNGQITRVPWPCGIEELRRFIDEKLLRDPNDGENP